MGSSDIHPEETVDFAIIGGGTAGCVLGRRLSEITDVSVTILEAGENKVDDPRITMPNGAAALYGNESFDWSFSSIPQEHSYGKVITYPRGKTVGGSSTLNILALVYPSKRSIDAWGELGNRNWSWNALLPYYRKFHTFHSPPPSTKEALVVDFIDEPAQGHSGPIQISYPLFVNPLAKVWPRTMQQLGWPTKGDPLSGESLGTLSSPYTVDPNGVIRSHAGNAYYAPVADRTNLHLETQAHVTKILFDCGAGTPKASGVEYISGGVRKTIKVRKEVILAAGTFHSAQLLELSGIGARHRLENLGIRVQVDNSNVGENLQDHSMTAVSAQVREGIPTGDLRRDPAFLSKVKEQYINEKTGPLTAGFHSKAFLPLSGWANDTGLVEVVTKYTKNPPVSDVRPSRDEQYEILRETILSLKEASVQIALGTSQMHLDKTTYQDVFAVTEPENFLTLMACLPHPFSAGTCHIVSSDPKTLPVVDPRYMSNPLDVEVLGRHTATLRKILETAPMSDYVQQGGRRLPESSPLFRAEGTEAEQDAAKEHARKYIRSMSHPCGTASMLPREKGGVVDSNLNVYGVENLRVVDASIFPMVPRGNIQSTVYAVAERAADFIKQRWGFQLEI